MGVAGVRAQLACTGACLEWTMPWLQGKRCRVREVGEGGGREAGRQGGRGGAALPKPVRAPGCS